MRRDNLAGIQASWFGHILAAIGRRCRVPGRIALTRARNCGTWGNRDGFMTASRALARPSASLAESIGAGSARLAALAVVLALVSLLGEPAKAQAAQANWWESLTGSGTPDYTGRRSEDRDRERTARQAEQGEDHDTNGCLPDRSRIHRTHLYYAA